MTLNLFYAEPDPDRWLPLDRYPRRVVRRLLRGQPQPGGQTRVFLNLCEGLLRLGVPFRVNDVRYIARHPDELACIIGKPFLLDQHRWRNPILFGASVFSHPVDDPRLLDRLPVARVLVPGPWIRAMFASHYGNSVHAWPVGIDTDMWSPARDTAKTVDVLIYDKVRWDHDRYERELLQPVRAGLRSHGLSFAEIRYGRYREEEFQEMLRQARMMVFLCEHETQGLAYQQALASNVPILAWDRGGEWRDPTYHPKKVKWGPVSSVPYWDERCGTRFENAAHFHPALDEFLSRRRAGQFAPREYILENLTLAQCAQAYVEHAASASELAGRSSLDTQGAMAV